MTATVTRIPAECCRAHDSFWIEGPGWHALLWNRGARGVLTGFVSAPKWGFDIRHNGRLWAVETDMGERFLAETLDAAMRNMVRMMHASWRANGWRG